MEETVTVHVIKHVYVACKEADRVWAVDLTVDIMCNIRKEIKCPGRKKENMKSLEKPRARGVSILVTCRREKQNEDDMIR